LFKHVNVGLFEIEQNAGKENDIRLR